MSKQEHEHRGCGIISVSFLHLFYLFLFLPCLFSSSSGIVFLLLFHNLSIFVFFPLLSLQVFMNGWHLTNYIFQIVLCFHIHPYLRHTCCNLTINIPHYKAFLTCNSTPRPVPHFSPGQTNTHRFPQNVDWILFSSMVCSYSGDFCS